MLILKRQGFVAYDAGTVADALAALARRPDWVLLDLMLPDGCGSQVLEQVVADKLPCKVCVITGCGPDRLERVRALGPHDVLSKPLDVGRLLALLTDPSR